MVHRLHQLFTEALQHVERKPAFVLDLLGQRSGASTLEQQGGAAGDSERFSVCDDVLVMQPGEHFALGDEPVVVRDVACHLENVLFFAAVPAHQQGVAGRAAPHALDDGEAAFQPVAGAGDAGVDRGFRVGGGEFILDPVQIIQEALDRVVARQQVGVGGELNQLLLPRAAAVHRVGQAQALADPQLFSQIQYRLGRRLAAEEVVGDAAEREDIEAGALRRVGPGGLGRKVDQPWVFDVVLDVAGAGGAVHGVGRCQIADVAGITCGRLPVHQPDVHDGAVQVMNEDALRPQGAVVKALGMRVLERLRDVAHELKALGDGEGLAALTQQVVQAHGFRVVIKDQRGPEFGFLVVLDLQDVGMVDAFEDLEFAPRLSNPSGPDLWAGRSGQRVDAHAPVHCVDADVARFPVLKALALSQQLGEPVVAHLAVLVGGTDARLSQATGDGTRLCGVNRRARTVGDAVGQCAHDAGIIDGARPAVLERGCLGQPFKPAGQAGGRQKNRWLDEGKPDLGFCYGRLAAQQAGEPLGLAVGQDDGVVVSVGTAVGGPRPAVRIAPQHAGAAFDFDQEQAGRGKHKRIDLADLAFIVDEFEVRPDVPGIAVGQVAAQPVQRFALPSKVGLCNDVPAGGAEGHGCSSAASGRCSKRSLTWQRKRRHSRSIAGRSTRVAVSL